MDRQNETGDFINKKQLFISLIFVTVMVLTLFLTVLLLLNNRITSLHQKNDIEEPVFKDVSTEVETNDIYTIKEFEGKIGVYKNGDFQYLLDIYVFTLPEQDKKSLLSGITVSTEQELLDILSSYY